MALTLRDPGLMADAQILTSYASSVAESSMTLKEFKLRGIDKESPEYVQLHAYFVKHAPKVVELVEGLIKDLG